MKSAHGTNQYSGTCTVCGEIVPAGEGIIDIARRYATQQRSRWAVTHVKCAEKKKAEAKRAKEGEKAK